MQIETRGALTKYDDGDTITVVVPGRIDQVHEDDWARLTRSMPDTPDFWVMEDDVCVVVWRIRRCA